MLFPAAITLFAVVFTVFVVVTLVLVVLVLRFTLQRAAAARARWLAEEGADEDDPEEDRPRTALVLSGGGTRGAVQIGMLQVLTEHGFVPDRIYGSSVGAVNGAAFAGDPTRLRVIDVRFTKPLVLPARVSVYTTPDHGIWVGGTAPGSDAYLEGRFVTTETETPR